MSFGVQIVRARTKLGSLMLSSALIRYVVSIGRELTFVLDRPDELKNLVISVVFVGSKPIHRHGKRTGRTRASGDKQGLVEVGCRWQMAIWTFDSGPSHSFWILEGQSMQLLGESVSRVNYELGGIVRHQREGMGLEVANTWDP